jgi:hypothetical protein
MQETSTARSVPVPSSMSVLATMAVTDTVARPLPMSSIWTTVKSSARDMGQQGQVHPGTSLTRDANVSPIGTLRTWCWPQTWGSAWHSLLFSSLEAHATTSAMAFRGNAASRAAHAKREAPPFAFAAASPSRVLVGPVSMSFERASLLIA